MKFIILFPVLIVTVCASSGPYRFSYEANDEGQHQRNEQGEHGQVQGSYSYVDPNGNLRQVNYVADEHGFRPTGDIGVDKETEAAAAELAAQAPQNPINFDSERSNYYNDYSGSKKGGYVAPKQKYPSIAKRPQKSYNKQRSNNYGSNEFSQQQQQTDSYSFNTEINHSQPKSYYNKQSKPRKPAPRQQKKYSEPTYQQEDDGSYDSSNDFESNSSYGPKQTVEYEVRAPTHKFQLNIIKKCDEKKLFLA